MAILISDELQLALKTTMVVTAILLFKFIFTAGIQAFKTGMAGLRAPEDAFNFGGKKQRFAAVATKDEKPESETSKADAAAAVVAARWKQIVLNDLENIPLGLLVIWAALLSIIITDNGSPKVHTNAVIVFCFGRVFHTLAYAAALSAARSLSFAAGTSAICTIAVNGVIAAW